MLQCPWSCLSRVLSWQWSGLHLGKEVTLICNAQCGLLFCPSKWGGEGIVGEVCRTDFVERIRNTWDCPHLVVSNLKWYSLLTLIVSGGVLEDKNAHAMEGGACCCCRCVVVNVVHSRCGEQPSSQLLAGTPPHHLNTGYYSCISKLCGDLKHSVIWNAMLCSWIISTKCC